MKKNLAFILAVLLILPIFADTTIASDSIAQPEGTLHDSLIWNFNEIRFSKLFNNSYESPYTNYVNKYVKGYDGSVFVYETRLMPGQSHPFWLHLVPLSGDTLVLKGGQKIYEQQSGDSILSYYAYRMKLYIDSPKIKRYRIDSLDIDMKYVLKNDSLIMLAPTEKYILGCTKTIGGAWIGRGVYNEVMTSPQKLDIPKTFSNLPRTHILEYNYSNVNLYKAPRRARVITEYELPDFVYYDATPVTLASIAGDNNHLYLGHFSSEFPDAWVKGQIDTVTNTVAFADAQYLGIKNSQHQYFRSIGVEKNYIEDDTAPDSVYFIRQLVLNVNRNTHEMNSNDGFYITCSDYLDGATANSNVTLKEWKETAGTPQNPFIALAINYDEANAYGGMIFCIPKHTTDSIYMNPAKLFYRVYLDDSLVTLSKQQYPDLEEGTTEIPYWYESEGMEIYTSAFIHRFLFKIALKSKVGIQLVYRGGNEVHESEIVWHELMTTAITNLSKEIKTVKSVSYYDLTGRLVINPTKGIYIQSEILSNGTMRNTKIIK